MHPFLELRASVRWRHVVVVDGLWMMTSHGAGANVVRSASFTGTFDRLPVNFADCLIGSPITWHNTGWGVQGRVVGFKNAIIVMTSNMGSQDILQAMQIDPDSVKSRVMAQVRRPDHVPCSTPPWRA